MEFTVISYTLDDFDKIFSQDPITIDDFVYSEAQVDSFENAVGLLFSIANVDNDSKNLHKVRKMVYDRGGEMVISGDEVDNIKFMISYVLKNNKIRLDYLSFFRTDGKQPTKINQEAFREALAGVLFSQDIWTDN